MSAFMPSDQDFYRVGREGVEPPTPCASSNYSPYLQRSDQGKRPNKFPQTPGFPQTLGENRSQLVAAGATCGRSPTMDQGSGTPSPSDDRWWSINDIAAYLSVSDCSARRLSQRRDFPAGAAFGRLRRWPSDQVRQWALRQTQPFGRPGDRIGLPNGVPRGPRRRTDG